MNFITLLKQLSTNIIFSKIAYGLNISDKKKNKYLLCHMIYAKKQSNPPHRISLMRSTKGSSTKKISSDDWWRWWDITSKYTPCLYIIESGASDEYVYTAKKKLGRLSHKFQISSHFLYGHIIKRRRWLEDKSKICPWISFRLKNFVALQNEENYFASQIRLLAYTCFYDVHTYGSMQK